MERKTQYYGMLQLEISVRDNTVHIRINQKPHKVRDLIGHVSRPAKWKKKFVQELTDKELFDVIFHDEALQLYVSAIENTRSTDAYFRIQWLLKDEESSTIPLEAIFDEKYLGEYIALRPELLISRGVAKATATPPPSIVPPVNILLINTPPQIRTDISANNFVRTYFIEDLEDLTQIGRLMSEKNITIAHCYVDDLTAGPNQYLPAIKKVVPFLVREGNPRLRLMTLSLPEYYKHNDEIEAVFALIHGALLKELPAALLIFSNEVSLHQIATKIIYDSVTVDNLAIDRALRNARSQLAESHQSAWKNLFLYMTRQDGQLFHVLTEEMPWIATSLFSDCGFQFETIQSQSEEDYIDGTLFEFMTTYPKVNVRIRTQKGISTQDIFSYRKALTSAKGLEAKKDELAILIYDGVINNQIINVLTETKTDYGIRIAPVNLGALEKIRFESAQQNASKFRDLVKPYLGQSNYFKEVNPITDPVLFFGQDSYLQELLDLVERGQHVAVFGLRRVGKTSLLRQCQLRLRKSHVVIMVEALEYADKNQSIYTKLALDIVQQLPLTILAEEIRELNQLSDIVASTLSPSEKFTRVMSIVLDVLNQLTDDARLIMMVDEIDRFLPSVDREGKIIENGYIDYDNWLATLRGIAQSTGKLVLVTSSTTTDISRLAKWNTRDNPFSKSINEFYITFLSESANREMIKSLSSWMDVSFTDEAIDYVFSLSGGHPFLARQLCARVFDESPDKGEYIASDVDAVQSKFVKDGGPGNYLDYMWTALGQTDEQIAQVGLTLRQFIQLIISQATSQQISEEEAVKEIKAKASIPKKIILDSIQEMLKLNMIQSSSNDRLTITPLLSAWIKRNLD